MAKSVKKAPAKAANDKSKVSGPNVTKTVTNVTPKTITLLVKENPKRGASKARFGIYRSGMSTEAYISKVISAGGSATLAKADLRWDEKRQYIEIR
jgi:hypothetical protein